MPRKFDVHGWFKHPDRDELALQPAEATAYVGKMSAAMDPEDKQCMDMPRFLKSNRRELLYRIVVPFNNDVALVQRIVLTRKISELLSNDPADANAKCSVGTTDKHCRPKCRLEVRPEQKPRNVFMAIMISVCEKLGISQPLIKFEWMEPFSFLLKEGVPRPLKLRWLNRNNVWEFRDANLQQLQGDLDGAKLLEVFRAKV